EGRPVLLGKGTFGRTYQARHCFLDTIVALKIITERYVADAAVRQRFLTEARAVAKLSHPHIARLYDFGEMNGVLHYAMEYCGGGSLADYVAQKGAVPLRQTIEIAASRLSRESYAARMPANLPPLFRDMLAQLLEKDRKNRFATAADVFKALNACAAALGFRRARDYTDPAAALEWEDAETTESGALDFTKLEPAEMESVEAELSSQFN